MSESEIKKDVAFLLEQQGIEVDLEEARRARIEAEQRAREDEFQRKLRKREEIEAERARKLRDLALSVFGTHVFVKIETNQVDRFEDLVCPFCGAPVSFAVERVEEAATIYERLARGDSLEAPLQMIVNGAGLSMWSGTPRYEDGIRCRACKNTFRLQVQILL